MSVKYSNERFIHRYYVENGNKNAKPACYHKTEAISDGGNGKDSEWG